MKRYAEYRDSGIEWIGEIAQCWDIKKFKHTVDLINVKGNVSDETYVGLENIESYTGRHIVTENNNIDGISNAFNTGDILFGKLRPYLAKCIIADFNGVCSSELLIFRNFTGNKRYLHRLLLSNGFLETVNSSTYGSKMPRASWDFIGQIFIPMPNLEEQQAIADYLDQKTSAIDTLITDKQKLIELLKEKHQAIISEAVTKGLDKTAKMKDSGIEWIGEIPEVWEVCKLKHIFANGEDGIKIGPFGSALKGKTIREGTYKIYNQAHLIQNDFSIDRHFISEDTFNELSSYEVHPGDILFSMMGTIGKCRIMPTGFPLGIMDSHLLKAKLNDRCLPEYFEYVYDKDNSNIIIEQLLYYSNGSIMNGLNSSIIKNVYFPLPDIKTQQIIIGYLKTKITSIDTLITDITSQIEKLKEYRQSVISEAVTGKVAI